MIFFLSYFQWNKAEWWIFTSYHKNIKNQHQMTILFRFGNLFFFYQQIFWSQKRHYSYFYSYFLICLCLAYSISENWLKCVIRRSIYLSFLGLLWGTQILNTKMWSIDLKWRGRFPLLVSWKLSDWIRSKLHFFSVLKVDFYNNYLGINAFTPQKEFPPETDNYTQKLRPISDNGYIR